MATIGTGMKFSYLLAALLLLFSIVTVVSADEGPHPLEQKVGGYKVYLLTEGPVKTGSSELVIKLRNEQGEPVDGATVEVELELEDAHTEEEDERASQDKVDKKKDDHDSAETTVTTVKDDEHDESAESEVKDDDHDKAKSVTFAAGDKPGEYHGTVDLEKSGNWKITVHFEVDHQENKVEFPLEVSPGFSKAGVLIGFLVVNTAVISGGAVQKRRLAAAKKAALQAKKDGAAKKANLENTTASDEIEGNL